MIFPLRHLSLLTTFFGDDDNIAASTGNQHKINKEVYDYVIIGAGWSGLGAGKTIQESGCDNFLILEAHDYVGGRSKTTNVYDDVFVEEGSTFLNGIDDNMVYDLVCDYDIGKTPYGFYGFEVWKDGALYPGDGGGMFMDYYNGLYKFWDKYWDNLDETSSLQTVIDNYILYKNIEDDPDELAILDAVVEMSVNYSYAADPSKFAVYAANFDWEMLGGDAVPDQGFSSIVDKYAESLLPNIKLNSKVTKVSYAKDPAEVTYVNDNGESVVIQAKKVLATLPVGALQAGIVEFDPPFSEQGKEGRRKQTAIDIMNPGSYEKVALFWEDMTEDEIFWNTEIEHIIHIEDPGSGMQGNFTYWNNFHFVHKTPMLYTLAAGEYADRIQSMPDEEVVAQAMERLRSHYGAANVPDPSHHVITRWKSDPTTLTVYAYAEVGAHEDTRDHLYEPLNGRLFFAGEATYETRAGTAQGALYSGVKVAYDMRGRWWVPATWEFFHYYFPLTSSYCRSAYRRLTAA